MARSLFNFRFRLLPWEACLNLNFHGIELAAGVGAVCTRDELGILMAGDPIENDTMRVTAFQLARGLVHAHAFCGFPTNAVLDVEPISWFEVPDWMPSVKPTVTGYMHGSLGAIPLTPDHGDNLPLREAASVIKEFGSNRSIYLALGDFHTARREPGPYSDFYAFRTLEDVGYSFGATKKEKPDWGAMNSAFGTTENTWRPLTDAGTSARHLKPDAHSTANGAALLSLAHDALSRAISYLRRGSSPSTA